MRLRDDSVENLDVAKFNTRIDDLRCNHMSMVAVNVEIAAFLVRNHRTELIYVRFSTLLNLIYWLEWLLGMTHFDPVIFLQSFLQRQPRLEPLLPDTAYRLSVVTLPLLAEQSWFNAVHFGDSWVLIGTPLDPLQSLINAIHMGKVDSRQGYIVVYLKGDQLNVVESNKA